jgi:tripartite-type tricarboxylate transporter receptor subunit TctC
MEDSTVDQPKEGQAAFAALTQPRMTKRGAVALLIGLAALVTAPMGSARAEDFPSRPITLVVPYPPGGNVDVSARILQRAIGDSLGQPLIIENKPGGLGFIAGNFVARAKPDGQTLFVASNGPILLGPLITTNPPYHWQDAFVPVSSLSLTPTLLLVRKDFPANSVKEFIDYARANPGKATVGYGGAGSINNLVSEMMQQVTGVKWLGVNFRGNAPMMIDLIGSHVDAGFVQPVDALPHIQSGAVRALAVIADKRIDKLPDVPTMAEAGYADVTGLTFSGLFAPRGTPRPIIEKLSKAIQEALKQPEVAEAFIKLGSEAHGSAPDEFTTFMNKQTAIWSDVVKKGHIHTEN